MSVSPLERLVKAASTGDVGELETVRAEFFKEAQNKESNAEKEFSKLLNSIESKSAHNALFAACISGGLAALEWVLKNGANTNMVTSVGNTALHTVISSQNPNIRRHAPHMVAALLNSGIQVDTKNSNGASAVALARSMSNRLLNSSQVLRTLEVNGSRWHGVLGVEEHGGVAKMAGSVLGFISGTSSILGSANAGSPEAIAANARNKVSKWAGGVFNPRWACITGPRLGEVLEFVVYETFEDTSPIFRMPANSCDLSAPLHKVAKQGAIRVPSALESVSIAVDSFRGHSGYSIQGLKPEDVLVRASLTSPSMSVHVQLPTPAYEELAKTLRSIVRHSPVCAEAVVAVPVGEGSGDMEVAEAVLMGPEGAPIEAQIEDADESKQQGGSGGGDLGEDSKSKSEGGNRISDPPVSNAGEMSEEEMILEAIRRSNLEATAHHDAAQLPSVPDLPVPPGPPLSQPVELLPYGGDVQAAMRAQDRNAIRQIMAARSGLAAKDQELVGLPTAPTAASVLPWVPTTPPDTDDEILELEARLASLRAAKQSGRRQREQDV